jgi:hypothetical protein
MHWIDPQSLPPIKGTVAQFVMNRDGELDGLVLTSETGAPQLVHFPPHLASEVEAVIKVGGQVAVHGVRLRGADVIAAVSLVTAEGRQIVDEGADAPHAKSEPSPDDAVVHDKQINGTVRLSLFGPKGELRGAILADGSVIRVGKKEADVFADLLKPGAAVVARGTAIVCPLGNVLEAHELGADERSLLPVKTHKPDKPKHEEMKKPKHDEHADA